MKTQHNGPPSEASNNFIIGPKKSNTAETHDKDFKIKIRDMLKDLTEDINKFLSRDCENTVE